MRTGSLYAATAVVLTFGFLMARGYTGGRQRLAEGMALARETRMEHAWEALDGAIATAHQAGYTNFNATRMAAYVANAATRSQPLTEEEMRRHREKRLPLPRPARHVVGKPTATWQIVLVPDDSARTIRAEMYTTNLKVPLKTKVLRL